MSTRDRGVGKGSPVLSNTSAMSLIVCKKEDVDEGKLRQKMGTYRNGRKRGIRSLVIEYEMPGGLYQAILKRKCDNWFCMIAYALKYPGRKEKKPVDVKRMIDLWAEVIPKLATAHDKDEADTAEARIDELLSPMLIAPVKQIREFYAGLVERLKTDPKVPFLIWRTFEYWHDQFVKDAPDQEVLKLKKGLATKITDMVEEAVRPDIREAMISALMWRSEGQLREVKEALKNGQATPRVKGRQSCLFLQVERPDGVIKEVML